MPAAPAGRFASRKLVSISRSHDWPARRGFVRLAPAASGEPLYTTMSATGRASARRSDDTEAPGLPLALGFGRTIRPRLVTPYSGRSDRSAQLPESSTKLAWRWLGVPETSRTCGQAEGILSVSRARCSNDLSAHPVRHAGTGANSVPTAGTREVTHRWVLLAPLEGHP